MDMHEQEFVPESQAQSNGQSADSLNEHEIQNTAQPYYWSTQKPNVPKDEPASLYDDPMVQGTSANEYEHGYSGYPGQSTGTGYTYSSPQSPIGEKAQTGQGGRTSQTRSRFQQQQYSPDGDAFEQQYQYRSNHAPYQQWSVPSWAHPQVQRNRGRSARWFWFVLLALVFIGPLMRLLGLLLVAGAILLAVILPLLIVGALIMLFLLSRIVRGRTIPQRRWW